MATKKVDEDVEAAAKAIVEFKKGGPSDLPEMRLDRGVNFIDGVIVSAAIMSLWGIVLIVLDYYGACPESYKANAVGVCCLVILAFIARVKEVRT